MILSRRFAELVAAYGLEYEGPARLYATLYVTR